MCLEDGLYEEISIEVDRDLTGELRWYNYASLGCNWRCHRLLLHRIRTCSRISLRGICPDRKFANSGDGDRGVNLKERFSDGSARDLNI